MGTRAHITTFNYISRHPLAQSTREWSGYEAHTKLHLPLPQSTPKYQKLKKPPATECATFARQLQKLKASYNESIILYQKQTARNPPSIRASLAHIYMLPNRKENIIIKVQTTTSSYKKHIHVLQYHLQLYQGKQQQTSVFYAAST